MPRESYTLREQEVYELVLRGFSNRGIAESLDISEGTARIFVEHIIEKVGVHNRRKLPGFALVGDEIPPSASIILAKLYPREREVAICIGRGYSNREIAKTLTLSVAVVQNYVYKILRKIEARSRTHLMAILAGRS